MFQKFCLSFFAYSNMTLPLDDIRYKITYISSFFLFLLDYQPPRWVALLTTYAPYGKSTWLQKPSFAFKLNN